MLIRRNIRTGERAYHYCYTPAEEPATLHRLVTAAGLRRPIEECLEFAKDYFALDHSQVHLYQAVKRHTILVAATLAIFAVIAAQNRCTTDTQSPPATTPDAVPPTDPGLIPLTIREIKNSSTPQHARPPPPTSQPTGPDGAAATKPEPAGSTNAPGSPETPRSPSSDPKVRLPY